ncbi:MAG: DUF4388 domain-containing protein [Chloroflexia bacterium]
METRSTVPQTVPLPWQQEAPPQPTQPEQVPPAPRPIERPQTARQPVGEHPQPPPPNPARPVLGGLLAAFPAGAVISLLNLQRVTGVLHIRNNPFAATIDLDGGEVIGATFGGESGLPALFYIMSWNTGGFEFRLEPPGPRTITLSLPVIQVRASLWMDTWNDLRSTFPTVLHRIRIRAQPKGEVTIQPHQWPVFTRITAEPMSIARLSEELNTDILAVTTVAAELVKLGLAVVIPPEK